MTGPAPVAGADQAAEASRRDHLMELATEHDVPLPTLKGWIERKLSPEAAARELLADFKAKAVPLPVSGAEAADAAGATTRVRNVRDKGALKPFASFGDQLQAVIQAGRPGGGVDPRLLRINAAASGMDETVGSEGGFFIQPDLLPGVLDPVYKDDPLLSQVTRLPISGNGVKFNVVDETSRATGSRWGAIQMYWVNEADTATAKKPKLRQIQLDLKKLMGIGYLTDELVEDAPASQALLIRAFRTELTFMVTDSVYRGSGGGQPLGYLNSGAFVKRAIEGGQTIANSNASISQNASKMLSRVPAALWGEVMFMYNQEFLNILINATIGTGSAVPLFIPAGGLGGAPGDRILGRPAYACEFCEAVGTPGDFCAVVPSQYVLGDKGGVNQASSLHVRFLYDELALRITYRVDGQPLWYKALTPYKGANSRSPYVGLDTRA